MAGVWKRDGTVAVTNGNKKVTGTGTTFADTKNGVAKGHLFCITSGTSVDFYEVDYVVSNTELYLVQAYRGITATGKAYEIITTFSDSVPEFARRLTATLSAYQQQSDAFQALLTSNAATIEVTAPDGTKQTLITWKRVTSEGEGQTARAKVEADRALSEADRAAGIVAAAALPLPDVWAPLSDSLRMISGYGRDVLVGSDVVARMVNFSRSSTKTYRAKDGTLKVAAVNEPAFEAEGLLLEGQSTNLFLNSENVAVWANPAGAAASTRELQAAQGGLVTCKVSAPSVNGGVRQSYTAPAGGVHTVSFYLSKTSALLRFALENGTAAWGAGVAVSIAPATGAITGLVGITAAKSVAFSDGYIYQLTLPPGKASGIINAEWKTDASGDFYIGMLQLEALPFASSYIPTAGAAVTRAADQAWIPAAGNRFIGGLYAAAFEFDLLGRVAGAGFSRLVDFDNSGGADRQHISLNDGGQLQCVMGTGLVAGVAGKLSGRAAMRMNNFTLNVMMDGVAGSSVTASGVGSSLNNRIVLMNSNLFNLPSYGHIRNLRMWSKHPISNDQLRTAV